MLEAMATKLKQVQVSQEYLIIQMCVKDDIILLQEPYIDMFGNTKVTKDWRVVYPKSNLSDMSHPHAIILISVAVDTNYWEQVHIPSTKDLVAIQICRDFGWLTIYNIYNDCSHLAP